MPRKGYKSVTLKETLVERLKNEAEKEGKSVSKYVTDCLEADLEVPADV